MDTIRVFPLTVQTAKFRPFPDLRLEMQRCLDRVMRASELPQGVALGRSVNDRNGEAP